MSPRPWRRGQIQKRRCPQEFSRVWDWASLSVWSFPPELLSPSLRGPVGFNTSILVSRSEVKGGFHLLPGLQRGEYFLAELGYNPSSIFPPLSMVWRRCDYSALSLHWAQNRLLWVGPRTWPHHVNVGKSILSDRHRGADPFLESRLYASWNLSRKRKLQSFQVKRLSI